MNDFERRSSSSIVPRKSSKLGGGASGSVSDLARMLEVNADQFQGCDHRIAVGDAMLALPVGNRVALTDRRRSF